jgi:YidC/Oxa1 family membrane protein insertase
MFEIILYKPLFNALIFLYESAAFNDIGIAIILLTIFVRILLYPIFNRTAKHQRIAQQLQPHIKEIKEKHKKDREAQTRAIMELYQKHKVNPLTPFFLLLVQLPVLIALYKIFNNINGFSDQAFTMLYSFIKQPGELGHTFLGIISLGEVSMLLAVLAAGAQYIQAKLAVSRKGRPKGDKQSEQMAKMATIMGPGIALIVLTRFPAAVALYWLTSSVFSIIQQVIVNKSVDLNDGGIKNESRQDNKPNGG